MLQWFTLTICLTASIFFISYWLRGNPPGLVLTAVAVTLETAVYCALRNLWQEGAFLAAIAAGQLFFSAAESVQQKHKLLSAKLFLYFGSDIIWLPLCLCSEEVWQYAVFLAAAVLCMAILPAYIGEDGIRKQVYGLMPYIWDMDRSYRYTEILPCAVLIPGIVLMIIVGRPTVFSAMGISTLYLLQYILLLWLQKEIIRRLRAEELNDAMSRWQRESRDYMNTIRSQRHDFNLHLHAISGLLGSGEYEMCSRYVQKLVSDTAAINDIMPVADAVVGSMLYNMREEARRQGSDITYHITYDMKDILCNGFECNKIIGNLLQNAIDALQTPEDKAYGICLNIFKRRGNTVITAENRFTGNPDRIAEVFEPGYSTKKGHDGIGLSMVLRTAEQYGGRVYPEFEQDVIRFVVNIPNKIHL